MSVDWAGCSLDAGICRVQDCTFRVNASYRTIITEAYELVSGPNDILRAGSESASLAQEDPECIQKGRLDFGREDKSPRICQ